MELTREFAEKLIDEESDERWEGAWEEVESVITGTNRHGTEYKEDTFHNKETDEYVCVEYLAADDGGDMYFYAISEVVPEEVKKIEYKKTKRVSI